MTSRRASLIFAAMLLSAASCLAQSVMTHHVRDVVKGGGAQANGRLPGNQVLQLDLVLPLRDSAGLKTCLYYQKVGATWYFDSAGFPGRTVELPAREK